MDRVHEDTRDRVLRLHGLRRLLLGAPRLRRIDRLLRRARLFRSEAGSRGADDADHGRHLEDRRGPDALHRRMAALPRRPHGRHDGSDLEGPRGLEHRDRLVRPRSAELRSRPHLPARRALRAGRRVRRRGLQALGLVGARLHRDGQGERLLRRPRQGARPRSRRRVLQGAWPARVRPDRSESPGDRPGRRLREGSRVRGQERRRHHRQLHDHRAGEGLPRRRDPPGRGERARGGRRQGALRRAPHRRRDRRARGGAHRGASAKPRVRILPTSSQGSAT